MMFFNQVDIKKDIFIQKKREEDLPSQQQQQPHKCFLFFFEQVRHS